MPEKTATQKLILEAVVDCIEKYGIDKVTTRRIAQQAGTNIASINYYFRSKDELINKTLAMTINHMMEDIFAMLDNPQLPFEQALNDVFFYLIDGTLRFPGISTAHLYKAVIEREYDSPSARGLNRVFERLSQRAIQEFPRRDPNELKLLLAQILSSIMFTMLAPDFFPLPSKYQLTSSKHATLLAQRCVTTFLASA